MSTTNPLDVIAGRHRELRAAMALITKTAEALQRERDRLHELEQAVGPAEHRDRTALGVAVVDGRKEPAREADELRRQVEEQRLRVDAVQQALQLANAGVAETVASHREWFRQQLREAARAGADYRASISAMEAARDRVSDETGALCVAARPGGRHSLADERGARRQEWDAVDAPCARRARGGRGRDRSVARRPARPGRGPPLRADSAGVVRQQRDLVALAAATAALCRCTRCTTAVVSNPEWQAICELRRVPFDASCTERVCAKCVGKALEAERWLQRECERLDQRDRDAQPARPPLGLRISR